MTQDAGTNTYKPLFDSPYEQYGGRNGEPFTVIGIITEADATHDAEVLPMYWIRFTDGTEIEAWPEEIEADSAGAVWDGQNAHDAEIARAAAIAYRAAADREGILRERGTSPAYWERGDPPPSGIDEDGHAF